MPELRAYEVNVIGEDWNKVIHAFTAGRAKYVYLRDVRESWPGVSFRHLTCKSLGAPRDDAGFRKTAEYRGVPFAHIGMKVEVDGHPGVIVGKNSSANFNVLFDGPKLKGTFNCHPNWHFKYFDNSGNLIKEFRD